MVTGKLKQILIAPLDWGLGHTARCVPIIRYIQSLGHVPLVACNASQRSFIEETFGGIDIIHLDGYEISYSGWNRWAQLGLLSQLPRIRRTIRDEHRWLEQLTSQHRIDGIISDNRYGLWHPRIPSIIITHQLMVQTGIGSLADRIIQKIHCKYLCRFGEVWVPDATASPGLAGTLSHPTIVPNKTQYIGLLSRFAESGSPNSQLTNHESQLLVLLSGPEPQRTALSRILWQQLLQYDGAAVFVEGSENAVAPDHIPTHITYHKRLTNSTLQPLLEQASMVICRSGYSTLMDLVALGKKAIVIPTPGQTEQEYLASMLHDAGIFLSAKQGNFQLDAALARAATFPFRSLELQQSFEQYKPILNNWIAQI